MRRLLIAPMLIALPLLIAAAPAETVAGGNDPDPAAIPTPIKAMLDAAIAGGSETEVATIVKFARTADPASADAVAQVAKDWHDKRVAAARAKLQDASFLDLWSGRVELGGWFSTGNTRSSGFTGLIDLTREGIQWRQKFRGQIDYQSTNGVTTRRHYLAAYEPNYKVDERAYIYGAAQYESDPFLGYDERYSVSAGAGYSAVKSPKVKLNLELGPAFRYTDFTDATTESSVAARGNVDFAWQLSPGLKVTQAASAYVEHYNSTVSSTTGLNAKLFGPLSAQLSYAVQYESMPPVGSVSTDTTGRASLVYTF